MLNDSLTSSLSALLTQLGPVSRRKAMREIAVYLRKANRTRIQRQQMPDGSDMPEREDRHKGKMFKKLKSRMRYKTGTDHAEAGFYGRMGYIATNHQLGKELQRRRRDGSTYTIDLPVRELLGLNEQDQQAINDILLKHIGGAFA